MESFKFAFRKEFPKTVFEHLNPLQWFTEFETGRLLSPKGAGKLNNITSGFVIRILDVMHPKYDIS